ncbi:MAG: CHAT domain-containing protein [Chloroflexota bacterium]
MNKTIKRIYIIIILCWSFINIHPATVIADTLYQDSDDAVAETVMDDISGQLIGPDQTFIDLILTPIEAAPDEFEAHRQAEFLVGEGEQLLQAGFAESARTKWQEAIKFYQLVDDPLGESDVHLRLASSYYPASLRCFVGLATGIEVRTVSECIAGLSPTDLALVEFFMNQQRFTALLEEYGGWTKEDLEDMRSSLEQGEFESLFDNSLMDPEALASLLKEGFSEWFSTGNPLPPVLQDLIRMTQQHEFRTIVTHSMDGMDVSAAFYGELIKQELDFDETLLTHADMLYTSGVAYYRADNCRMAERDLADAQDLYQRANFDVGKARALAYRALCQAQAQVETGSTIDPIAAFEAMNTMIEVFFIVQSLPLGDEISERYFEAKALFEQQDWQGAQDIYKEVEDIYRLAGNKEDRAGVMLQIGNTYVELNQLVDARHWYEQALALLQSIDDATEDKPEPFNRGALYHNLSNVALQTGHYKKAEIELIQAIWVWQKIGEPVQEVESLIGLGVTLVNQGEFSQALAILEYAQQLSRRLPQNPNQESALLGSIAHAYAGQGKYDDALAVIDQALAMEDRMTSDLNKFLNLSLKAAIQTEAGYFEEAEALHQQLIAEAAEANQPYFQAVTTASMGGMYTQQGMYREAITAYTEALSFFDEGGREPLIAAIEQTLGTTYFNLGDLEKAEVYLLQSLQTFEEIQNDIGIAAAHTQLGLLYADIGDLDQAETYFDMALHLWESLDSPVGVGVALNNLALLALEQRELQTAIDYSLTALDMHKKTGFRAYESQSLFVLSLAYLFFDGENDPVALDYIQQIQDLAETAQNTPMASFGHILQGTMHYKHQEFKQAYEQMHFATEFAEQARIDLMIPELKTAGFHRLTDIYELAMAFAFAAGEYEQAFLHTEQSRARTFLDQLGNTHLQTPSGIDEADHQQLQQLRQKMSDLQTELTGLSPFANANLLSAQLEQTQQTHADLLFDLKLADPEYASLVSVDALTLAQVQSEVLDDQTTLILYHMDSNQEEGDFFDEQTRAWVVEQDAAAFVTLNISATVLNGQIDFLRQSLEEKESDIASASILYDALITPLKPYIHNDNLIIVPHQTLHYLPFAALWNADEERYLLEEYTITYAPSASVLKFIQDKRNPNEGRLLALGNPDGSLDAAEREVKAIASMFNTTPLLGDDATESHVMAQAHEFDILHLAAHGKYDEVEPLSTQIQLTSDSTNDGRLEVREIFDLNLSKTNLVVLSACDTSLANFTRGDELVGLPRAFIYAGTPAVMTTLWPIDDIASATLMESFYTHWQTGMTTAKALRTAQLEVLAEDKWSSPYYWAAFGLTGDYR